MTDRKIIYLDDAIDALEREKTYSAVYKYGYTQTDYFKQYNMGLTDGIKALNKLPSAQPEQSSEIQDILEYLDTVLHPIISPDHWNVYSELHDMISMLSSAQSVDKDINVPANDLISRQAAIKALHDEIVRRRIDEDTNDDGTLDEFDTEAILRRLPSAQQYTEEEIQAMQDLEQAQLDKAYQIGVEEGLQSAQPEQIARDIATIIENEQDMRVLLKNTERTETNDLVSRRTAIETAENVAYAVDEHGSADGWLSMLVNSLEILPSAQPRWIPVSEALPEDGEYMFSWITSDFPNKRFIGIGEYEEGEWLFDDYMNAYVDVTVTAWFPLPEPYKEGTE